MGPDPGVQAQPANPVAPMAPMAPPAAPAAPGVQNVFDTSSSAYNSAYDMAQGLPGLAQGMQGFQNPYQEAVLDNTLGRMGDQFQQRLNQVGDAAVAGGSFGGSRHGLVEGQAFDDYMRNVGETSANINRQGFMDSAALAGQEFNQNLNQINQLRGLANQGFDFGRTLNQDQYRMGSDAQQQQQRIIDAISGQFDANNPLSWIMRLTGGLAGSPLGGNTTQTGSGYTEAGTGTKVGAAAKLLFGLK